ncbi:MAG: hypothetical protein M3N51_09895 [Actinomycetota bacterium]|nr:hypothetical protein [Actinomycetota bacterium]
MNLNYLTGRLGAAGDRVAEKSGRGRRRFPMAQRTTRRRRRRLGKGLLFWTMAGLAVAWVAYRLSGRESLYEDQEEEWGSRERTAESTDLSAVVPPPVEEVDAEEEWRSSESGMQDNDPTDVEAAVPGAGEEGDGQGEAEEERPGS